MIRIIARYSLPTRTDDGPRLTVTRSGEMLLKSAWGGMTIPVPRGEYDENVNLRICIGHILLRRRRFADR